MAYTMSHVIKLEPTDTGLILKAQLIDGSGVSVGGEITTGFTELANGEYIWEYAVFPDAHRGGAKILSGTSTYQTTISINPEEAENDGPVDGLTRKSFSECILAFISGQTSVTDLGGGITQIVHKKQDGSTAKITLSFNADGEWTASTIS